MEQEGKGKEEERVEIGVIDLDDYDDVDELNDVLDAMDDDDEWADGYEVEEEPLDVKAKLRSIQELLIACHSDVHDILCYLEDEDKTVNLDMYKLQKLLVNSQNVVIDLKKAIN